MRFVFACLSVAVLAASSLCAAPEDYEGKTISRIDFQPATQPLPLPEIYNLMFIRPQRPYRAWDTQRTIKRLFATGRFADIRVDAVLENGQVAITIMTQARWFIGSIGVTGVKAPPNPAQLASTTKLELGTVFSEEKLGQAVKNIERTLEQNGYYGSRVETETSRDEAAEQVFVKFGITTPDRATYTMPTITGDPKPDPEEVLESTGWKRWLLGWKKVTDSRTQEGLEKVRRSYVKEDRLLTDVKLEALNFDPDSHTVSPALSVNAGPEVAIQVTGAKVSRDKLKRLIPVFDERAIDRDLLMEGAKNLTEDFQSQGYFDAQVDFDFKPVLNGRQVVEYKVDRGDRGKLVQIDIKGNKYFDVATVRERMAVTVASFQFRRGRFSQSLLDRDLSVIRDLYQSNGFKDVKVEGEAVKDYNSKAGEYAVSIRIEEGPQYHIADFTLTGVESVNTADLMGLISSTKGQIYSSLNIAVDRDSILAYYYQKGFANATFESTVKQGVEPNTVDLQYAITENEKHSLRGVLVNGLGVTNPKLVRSKIRLSEGDPLSMTQVVDTQRRLYGLGIFSRVDTAIQNPEGDEEYKYVVYEFEEARRWSVATGFGLEFGRLGGATNNAYYLDPVGGTAFSPRVSFDITRLNVMGKAHTASLNTRYSNLQKRALLTYLEPGFLGKEKMDLTLTALYDDSRNVRTFAARRVEGSLQVNHAISRIFTAFYRFSFRYVTVDQNTLRISPELVPLASQPVRIGIPSVALIQDRRDDPINSTRGMYNSIDAGVAARFLGSDANFARLLFRNSTYHRVTKKLVLARSLNFGWLKGLDTGVADIPLPERFFSGGATSHRGFPELQAGVRDLTTGFPLGGTAMFFNNLEARFPLVGANLGGVLFYDLGNDYSSIRNVSFRFHQRDVTDFDYMVHAAGFGVRYNTPIGPIRLDLAYSINPPSFMGYSDVNSNVSQLQHISHFQFFFSLGQTF